MSKPKSYHENYAKFFESPTREGLRDLLKNNVGELRSCDFKAQWPDHPGLAKHVLGMANSGGGCLVAGVAEQADKSLEPIGMATFTDKAVLTNGLKSYLPATLLALVDVADFAFDASEYPKLVGKKFQVLFVEFNPSHLPFVSMRDGSGIRTAAIYIRREGSTEEASHDELQKVLNVRIETGYSTAKEIDLQQHLNQLKILLAEIPRTKATLWTGAAIARAMGAFTEPNPNYPKEGFEAFVLSAIKLKKRRIADELDIAIQEDP